MKQGGCCSICKVMGLLAVIGALNWGSIAVFQVNFVESLLGAYPMALRIVYGLVGISGLALIAGCLGLCPGCKSCKS